MQRLQKIMAAAGIASRRKCEEIIAAGKVTVNGAKASIGQSADPEKDDIRVDGRPLQKERKVYIALNKPRGYVTTVSDEHAERKVTDLVRIRERVYPVGRLDADSEGLLLLTNDGEFANKVMHPRYNIDKVYVAKLTMPFSEPNQRLLERGIYIDGIRTRAKVKILGKSRKLVEVTIHEGRHKIVKRMFKELGNYVVSLMRVRIGPFVLGNLRKGQFRYIGRRELDGFEAKLQSSSKNPFHK